MSFAEKIKRLRQEKNWSQDKLAQKIEVSRVLIGKYERGQTVPSTETLQKLSEIFGVSIDYLLSEESKNLATVGIKDQDLLECFEEIDRMSDEEKMAVKYVLDAVILKHRMRKMVR
jgi:transcriptional regulator with XRE-family HTH domain